MSLTLKDLRVTRHPRSWEPDATRPASLADLVEVLKQEGAVEHQFCGSKSNLRKGKPLDLTCIYTAGHFPTCGRYLILPLGDTPK